MQEEGHGDYELNELFDEAQQQEIPPPQQQQQGFPQRDDENVERMDIEYF